MLARHLNRLTRPVRYAMDPAHEAAIRNYLALTTRAYDVPGIYQQARPHLPQGHEGALLHQLFSSLIGEHDPSALAAFLDAHQDITGQPRREDTRQHDDPHEELMRLLAGMHEAVTDQYRYDGHPVVPQFATPRLYTPITADALRTGLGSILMGHPHSLNHALYSLLAVLTPPLRGNLAPGAEDYGRHLANVRNTYNPLSLVHAQDAATNYRNQTSPEIDYLGGPTPHMEASRAVSASQAILRDHVIPSLLHQ